MEILLNEYTNLEEGIKLYKERKPLYYCLKRIEEILGYNNDAILSLNADDVYWTIFRKEDSGHYTDRFINELKVYLKAKDSRELKFLIESLANIISREYQDSSLETDLRKVIE